MNVQVSKNINESRTFEANNWFLIGLLLTLCCGGFQIGHVIACTNNLASTFEEKFQQFKDNPTLYQSLLGSSGILGSTIGALSGGSILKIGRKNTFIIASVIGFIGTSASLIENLTWILSGRLIYGVGCGILSIAGPRFIEETVPDRLVSLFSPLFMCSVAFGGMIALLMGAGLPNDNNPEALKSSNFWKLIIGAPLLLQIVSVLSMQFYVKYDSIRFLVFKGNYANARDMIKKVYAKTEKATTVMDYIEETSRRETSSITLKDCFTVLEYRRSTLVAMGIIIFHELTGENAIMLYSTEIFKRMESYKDSDNALTPR